MSWGHIGSELLRPFSDAVKLGLFACCIYVSSACDIFIVLELISIVGFLVLCVDLWGYSWPVL